MNMQIAVVATLFAVLIVIPQNTFGQNYDQNYGQNYGQNPDAVAEVIQFESNNQGGDGYQYIYQTSNGISGQEQANFQSAGEEEGNAVVQGQYSYTGIDGKQYVVSYTADENGYHPKSIQ